MSTQVYRTEKMLVRGNKDFDTLCWYSKNLYNEGLFWVRQNLVFKDLKFDYRDKWQDVLPSLNRYGEGETKKWVRYEELNSLLGKGVSENYSKLHSQTAQQTLIVLDKNLKSYFSSIKDYKKNPEKYNGVPKIPNYKDSKTGRFEAIFPKQGFKVIQKDTKKGVKTYIRLSTKNTLNHFTYIETRLPADTYVKEVRVNPVGNNNHFVEIIYKEILDGENIFPKTKVEQVIKSILDGTSKIHFQDGLYLDLGVNNLATCLNGGDCTSFIINGRPVKAINQWYNKQLANAKSLMSKNYKKDSLGRYIYYKKGPNKGKRIPQQKSNKTSAITLKRNNRIKDYFHKSANYIVEYAYSNNLKYIVIGNNPGWKQEINMGKKNNQKFAQIPHGLLMKLIEYKAEKYGIIVVKIEESYTSKVDHLACETMEHHDTYLGKRKHRGLFVSSLSITLNADVNGAIGIARKVSSESSFEDFKTAVIVRGFVNTPFKYTPIGIRV